MASIQWACLTACLNDVGSVLAVRDVKNQEKVWGILWSIMVEISVCAMLETYGCIYDWVFLTLDDLVRSRST